MVLQVLSDIFLLSCITLDVIVDLNLLGFIGSIISAEFSVLATMI